MEVFAERNIPAFRFNLDLFDSYRFEWSDDEFEIYDPTNRYCKSSDITAIAFYKGILPSWVTFENNEYTTERDWLISWLNRLYDCIMCYGKEHNLIKLWYPHGFGYSKTYQMKIAKKFFEVPSYKLHWGKTLPSKNVIVKPLTQRPLSNGEMIYAKIVDRSYLDPSWPWFTQQIARGNRDATVLYINGKVHCYQFATERNDLTDWRITQGTERNQWIKWNTTKEFDDKVCQYMNSIDLKYGRLDFIIGDGDPQFLEVNPEGQFGWLDDENLTLHKEVVDAILDSSSTVQL
jgi:hypothetical protein